MIDCPKLVLRLRTQQSVYEKADAFNLADDARQAADAIEELEGALLLMVYQYCQGPDERMSHDFMTAGETAFEVLGIEPWSSAELVSKRIDENLRQSLQYRLNKEPPKEETE